jgi:hypothetical protein
LGIAPSQNEQKTGYRIKKANFFLEKKFAFFEIGT